MYLGTSRASAPIVMIQPDALGDAGGVAMSAASAAEANAPASNVRSQESQYRMSHLSHQMPESDKTWPQRLWLVQVFWDASGMRVQRCGIFAPFRRIRAAHRSGEELGAALDFWVVGWAVSA
jgi:hypothetical protein